MISDLVTKKIQSALAEVGASAETTTTINLQYPSNDSFGDYTTNIALRLSKDLGKPPFQIAGELASHILPDETIESATAVQPGFINVKLTPQALLKELISIQQQKEDYGKAPKTNKTIIMEFGQPNTHKLPHIGHLFSYMYGESMSRILGYEGNTVFRANYQGDIGLHVAKCLWQVLQDEKTGSIPKDKNLAERCLYLQKCYQAGSAAYEESEQKKEEINAINKKIYEHDPQVYDLWQETRKWSLDFYQELETQLGVTYDRKFFETETAAPGKETVLANVGKVFEKDDGAVIFRGENYGQHTRVFINKEGNPTYEAKDVGLIQLKMQTTAFDMSITSTAVEQQNYWNTVNTALELLFPELKGKLKHVDFGMINLKSGKMSSRTGNIIDAIGLIDLVKEEIQKEFPDQTPDTVETVALAAIKYSFLKSEVYKNKAFDIKTSISRDGDSGPYLLYTYVRCNSILSKEPLPQTISIDTKTLTPEELALLRFLPRLEGFVHQSYNAYSPHLIALFLFQLAQKFNLFYQKNPVIKAEGEQRNLRLAITAATASVLKNGLHLMGIETVEKM